MKITDVKVGTRAFNKVNGLTYQVTGITGTGKSMVATLETIDAETSEVLDTADENYDAVTITEGNDICFKNIYTPANTEIPDGYSVENGCLMKDGEPVTEQGQIVVDSIIAELPGYLVIGVKPRTETDNLIDLFSYDPEKDNFRKLIRSSSIPTPKIIMRKENAVVLGYSKTHSEPVLDEDGKETDECKEVFDCAALMIVHDKKVDAVRFSRPIDLELLPIKGSKTQYLLGTTKAVDDDNVVSESKPYYREIEITEDCIYENDIYRQPLRTVESAALVNIEAGGIVLKGKDFILYNDLRIDSPLAEKIPGSYLVDITCGEHEVTVTMADEDYNISSIVRKDTRDRGYIVSIA